MSKSAGSDDARPRLDAGLGAGMGVTLDDRPRHLARIAELASRKSRQALQIRSADNTALGERAAGEADLDAAALRWALRRLDNI